MSRAGQTAKVADCYIELEQGDITKQTSRCIVNSVCGGANLGGKATK